MDVSRTRRGPLNGQLSVLETSSTPPPARPNDTTFATLGPRHGEARPHPPKAQPEGLLSLGLPLGNTRDEDRARP